MSPRSDDGPPVTAIAAPPARQLWFDRAGIPKAWMLFTLLAGMNLLDLVITHLGIRRGVLIEANPLMEEIVGQLWSSILVKVLALGVVAGFVHLVRTRPTVVHCTLYIAIAWYTLVVLWNTSIVAGA